MSPWDLFAAFVDVVVRSLDDQGTTTAQLSTCDSSVLEVAVEAGYGSHEAFTRAFQAAGVTSLGFGDPMHFVGASHPD